MTPQQKYREANREKIRLKQKEYYQRTKDKQVIYAKEYSQSISGKQKRKYAHLKHKYGITQEQYDALEKEQNNSCAICKQPEQIVGNRLSVDHCHTTGKIRGLLCRVCNSALGKFKDSPDLLKNALAYLEHD